MTRRGIAAILLAAFAAAGGGPAATARAAAAPGATRPAYLVLELPSGRRLAAGRPELLRTPVLLGSILKVATLVAALDTGVIGPGTALQCRRHVVVDGRDLACSHPDVGRPLGPSEALAHSCNSYFAAVASRLPREALDRALVGLGLPPSAPGTPVVPAALGLGGSRVAPERLLEAFVRWTTARPSRLPERARAVVLEGLRGAADYGTARAFHDLGMTALAKTGTAPMPGGGYQGLAVAVVPADAPRYAVVALVPGAAGADAARVAAERLVAVPGGPGAPGADGSLATIRVGVTRPSGGYDVIALPLEDYVARVVSAEAAVSSGFEARKALAIVVRTFALANRGRHAREGFDLCDLTHCQVMAATSRAEGIEAARATRGQVIYRGGALAHAFYSASCGGRTERPSAVWPGEPDPPSFASRDEPECRRQSAWTSDLSASEIERALRAAGRRGSVLRDLHLTGRTASGRAESIRAEGFEPPDLRGEDFRLAVGRALGWQRLKSTLFTVERTATGYRFRGNGSGHGVGLCVAGSARLASRGLNAAAILQAYFPGTEVRATAGTTAPAAGETRLTIVLPSGEERERARIGELARDAVQEFGRRLGVPAPDAVKLVFHSTVEAFRQASGQPWWTAGATRGTEVHFIPPAALRQRGILERTLRHELAHVVSAPRLVGRPVWVQEAVAMWMALESDAFAAAGPRSGAGAREACPSDGEWHDGRSPEALQALRRRAAACYAAQVAAGRHWDEVR